MNMLYDDAILNIIGKSDVQFKIKNDICEVEDFI